MLDPETVRSYLCFLLYSLLISYGQLFSSYFVATGRIISTFLIGNMLFIYIPFKCLK